MVTYAASRRWRSGAVVLATALVVGACSQGAASTTTVAPQDSVVGGAPAPVGIPAEAPGSDSRPAVEAKAAAAGGVLSAPEVSLPDTKVIRTASIYLTVTSVETSAAAVRGVAAGLGGHVSSETVNATDVAPTADPVLGDKAAATVRRMGNYGQLVLAVPADRLDAALDQLSTLGTVVQRATASEDVTGVYIDTESRIATKKASIERVRALMTQTQNLVQVVELENQLAQREAELESLQAQLASMANRIAMSTITVTVSTSPQTVTAVDDNGFMAGLRSGWTAFLASLKIGLTILGALVPWVIALALIGLPLLAWRRRRTSWGTAGQAQGSTNPMNSTSGAAAGPAPMSPAAPEPTAPTS